MDWRGWGDSERAVALPDSVVELLSAALGVRPPEQPPVELDDVTLPARSLTEAVRDELAEVVGADHVRTDAEARIRHTRGKSTADLLRIRAGDGADAPDAVVLPGSDAEVVRVLEVCAHHRVAVVPFGGGTSVVGGLAPEAASYTGVVALDLRRMNRLVEIDSKSRLATFEPGLQT